MSIPSAPYYYKEGSDTYHWETSCSKNNYPAQGWKKTNSRPSQRNSAMSARVNNPHMH